ncbi:cytochrome c oxidase, subunit VIa [Gilbertella persicaria]|uniref:cytochrome c oxidase, subunit VIa n=1 Tax=Gilbertella persicaria TaxID=101096 RepID=UPI00221E9CCB|nr:cytochrome c oxidase, subunit VIa [Gilbertella persicaria]KAI8092390.1 cytochrome c oxidase, subunit VIa [Gilbertella persicaria]
MLRSVHQIKRIGLRYQSQVTKSHFEAERQAVKHHAADAASTWKKISLFVCVPTLLAAGINAYNLYSEHQHHLEEHPPEWIGYDYMNFRARNFFWGPNSFLFNPKVNHDVTLDK